MANNQFVLAFSLDQPECEAILRARREATTHHIQQLASEPVKCSFAGDAQSGLISWDYETPAITWAKYAETPCEAVRWLNIPARAEQSWDGTSNTLKLARSLVDGHIQAWDLGAPWAMVRWTPSSVELANDMFGLARMYEFMFPGWGTVWSSRYDIAHIFAARLPEKNGEAWLSMATLGWTVDGQTHLGHGRQLPPATRLHSHAGVTRRLSGELSSWISEVTHNVSPSVETISLDLKRSLKMAQWWPQQPIADLSGGKDSRVTAAAAIVSQSTNVLRTVDTDAGEVSTARHLVKVCPANVIHKIQEATSPSWSAVGFQERLGSLHAAWEGTMNARTGVRGQSFRGFHPVSRPKINGLGGEGIQGRTLISEKWESRLAGGDFSRGLNRIHAMIVAAPGSSAYAREVTSRRAERLLDDARCLESNSAFFTIDYFYNFSKMPYWSAPLSQQDNILPYYSPAMMRKSIFSMSHPEDYGMVHRKLLAQLVPAWASVPFYKGSGSTRTIPRIWESPEWSELAQTIDLGGYSLESFDGDVIRGMLRTVETGQAKDYMETTFCRVLWEFFYNEHVNRVQSAVRDVRRRLDELGNKTSITQLDLKR